MVGPLSEEGQKQTHRSTRHIYKEMVLTECSIVQIIHRDLCLKCLVRLTICLLPVIVSFSYTCVSQGSAATQLRCGGTYTTCLIANCLQNVPVKTFENWSISGEDMNNDKVGRFLGHSVYGHSTTSTQQLSLGITQQEVIVPETDTETKFRLRCVNNIEPGRVLSVR